MSKLTHKARQNKIFYVQTIKPDRRETLRRKNQAWFEYTFISLSNIEVEEDIAANEYDSVGNYIAKRQDYAAS